MKHVLSLVLVLSLCGITNAQKKKDSEEKPLLNSGILSGLKFRCIGPALTSGRIADIAVNPNNHSEYYVASASGGVWKTTNAGTTYEPIFDGEGSYSIGCVTIDPGNPHIVWVGTGENNNQRSVAYGDGIYKSEDGGKSWKNMGLKESEHIGNIIVHPENSDIVYVAAYGPLWSAGGDRGVYKTTDGGKSWKAILTISEHTGVSQIAMDPRNPDWIYAASHQRRRHVFTYLGGGPETNLFRTKDGGATWDTLKTGLPTVDKGRIGLAISPVDPDYVYAIIEASDKKGGFFRSADRGASWKKMGDYSTSGNYYQEIVCDPVVRDRVYSLNTWGMVTNDGGKTWKRTGEKDKHVDNHALWIDPNNTDHFVAGCDGGLYESWDRAKTWQFKANLPVTQFYKVEVDNSEPFYYVYGGTQDNFSIGGPSRTTNVSGIVNSDWFITHGGDGFETQIDPVDPNIVYAQSQYGWLARYDRKSGEEIGIKPMEKKGEPAFRWNWDAPLLISPHSHTRLYFAANKVFRSDDRGNTWDAISPDLTRQIDRNKLTVMGKVWSMDAVAKNKSTTIYGNIVALSESPMRQNLVYAGTDDGLIQVLEGPGANWRKVSSFPGVPDMTYVNSIIASQHNENIVYAAFNNHKRGDFKPYVYKSTDRGTTWSAITSDLPERGSVYAIAEDHVDPNLLFVGTEFGVFFTNDGGKKWIQLKTGLPTIAVRDIAIQKRENDLVLASFGRGFYILDDYSPLRTMSKENLEKQAHIFPIKDALVYIEAQPLGLRGKSFQGASYYTEANPRVGATFTYYMKKKIKTLKEQRQDKEKKAIKANEKVSYPSFDKMRAEDMEEKPYLLFTIKDETGAVVCRIKTDPKKGVNRITWDGRYPSASPTRLKPQDLTKNPFSSADVGHFTLPGKYTVSLSKSVNGQITELLKAQPFTIKSLDNKTLPAEDKAALLAFEQKTARLQRAVFGANRYRSDLVSRIKHLKEALRNAPEASITTMANIKAIEVRLSKVNLQLNGDRSLSKREFETTPGISGRVGGIVYNLWQSSCAPTTTMKDNYNIAGEEFAPVLAELKKITNTLTAIEDQLEKSNAPWTPGRLPDWTAE